MMALDESNATVAKRGLEIESAALTVKPPVVRLNYSGAMVSEKWL